MVVLMAGDLHPPSELFLLNSSVQALAGLTWKARVVLITLNQLPRLQRQALWSGQQVSCMAFKLPDSLASGGCGQWSGVTKALSFSKYIRYNFSRRIKRYKRKGLQVEKLESCFSSYVSGTSGSCVPCTLHSHQPLRFHPLQVFVPDYFLLGIF